MYRPRFVVNCLFKGLVVLLFLFLFSTQDAFAGQVQLGWNQSTDSTVIGYKLYHGTQSRNYTDSVDVQANLTYLLSGLSESQAHYFAVTDYSSSGESAFSDELVCYPIQVSSPTNGQILPGTIILSQGGFQTFSIVPGAGYAISNVLVDGVSAGSVSQYTFSNLSAPHTISASFTASQSYSITASTSGNGSISPSGTVNFAAGANQTFIITPNANYNVSDVQVDGTSVGVLTSYSFSNISANHTITASFAPNTTYTITATALANGSISPSGKLNFAAGANQPFTITPNANYHVSDVQVDGTSVGAVTGYCFYDITSSHTITASFAPNTTTYTITPTAQANGSISPASAVTVNSGASQTVTITPNANYHVSDVQVDGTSVGAVTSYTFSNITANHTITASFAQNTFTITPTAQANGSISPASAVTVNGGASQTVTITPNTNYHVLDVKVDGTSVGAVTSYTFSNITANHTISASFAQNTTYTITPTAQANGAISPASAVTVNGGASQTVTITPNTNYHVSDVTVDGTSVGAVTSYTFSNITANHTITASFAQNTFTITPTAQANGSISPASAVTVNGGASQTVTITPNTNYHVSDVKVDGTSVGAVTSYTFSNITANHTITASFAQNTFTITPTAQANGSISPASAVTINSGASQTVTITPNTNYHVSDVKVDGTSVGAVTSYTFSNIIANHTISASFTQNTTYTITPTAQANGSISPASVITVNSGASQTVTITPNTNYHVSDVKVDGTSVGAVTSYTFSNITANHTITASFALNTFTITPTAQANGSISPVGAVTVNCGGSQTFTITPNANYHVAGVTVDGLSAGVVSSYTFSNVTANHTISASFVTSLQPPIADAGPNQVVTKGATVTLNGSNSAAGNAAISSYSWTQTGGTSVAIANRSAAQTTFTAPSVGAGGSALTFKLTVTDVAGAQATNTCIVNVENVNQPPTAKTGADQTVSPWTIVTLDGSKSTDSDGSGLSYLWEQTEGPAVTLSSTQTAQPTFVAPDVDSDGTAFVFRLTVTDAYGLKSTDTSIINVTSASSAPQALAGSSQTVNSGVSVTLDGSRSTDIDGSIASFRWHQTSGAPVKLSNSCAAKPTFTAPSSGADGNPLNFMLTVTDTGGLKSRSAQTVTVKYAGADLTGKWSSFGNAKGTLSGILQVSNVGNQAASWFSTAFYLSNDGVNLSTLLNTQFLYSVSPGASSSLKFQYTGSNLSGKYIIAIIDPANGDRETNETNNVIKVLIP